ncbi:MAG TPA: hypothetical protein VFJ63_00875 [Candidatus Bathyarchaeia archaeon]|nr:hypothetical protein [Candidatus Bathyarchaeia archaeon]
MWQVIQLSSSTLQVSLSDPRELLDIGAGVFAFVLFAVSLYAWYIRRQFALAIVSLAFLVIFVRTLLREFLSGLLGLDFITDSLEFVALTLFFVAIVIRPRKDVSKTAF